MAALVGYASSDEDEEAVQVSPGKKEDGPEKAATQEPSRPGPSIQTASEQDPAPVAAPAQPSPSQPSPSQPSPSQPSPSQPPIVGPIPQHPAPMGPSRPPTDQQSTAYLPEPEDEEPKDGTDSAPAASAPTSASAPSSPYTATRALLRDLTLPTHPNLDIPPSPPGSPPPPTLNKRFEEFLDLKKKGVHFNSKLANNAALRNPALMDKLMGFVDLGPADAEDGDGSKSGNERAQYATTLPQDIWDPTGANTFPDWAFRKPLRETQEKMRREREAERASGKRGAVDFVPSAAGGTPTSGSGTEAGGLSKGKRKAGGW